jgi:hypothetical protein
MLMKHDRLPNRLGVPPGAVDAGDGRAQMPVDVTGGDLGDLTDRPKRQQAGIGFRLQCLQRSLDLAPSDDPCVEPS